MSRIYFRIDFQNKTIFSSKLSLEERQQIIEEFRKKREDAEKFKKTYEQCLRQVKVTNLSE